MAKVKPNTVLDSLQLDTRHTSALPLLQKLEAGQATVDDVNQAVDEDSRLEPLRDVLTRIASGKKVTPKEVEAAVDSKHEPLKPLLLALVKARKAE